MTYFQFLGLPFVTATLHPLGRLGMSHLLMGDVRAIMESNAHSDAKKCEAVKHRIHRESTAASGVSASALSDNVGSSGSSGRTCNPAYTTSADKNAVV